MKALVSLVLGFALAACTDAATAPTNQASALELERSVTDLRGSPQALTPARPTLEHAVSVTVWATGLRLD